MTDKMTNAKAIAYVLANCEIPSEVAEKLTAIKASIEKKNARKSDKPTAKQTENEAIKTAILDTLATPQTVGAVAKALDLSSQKINALMLQLIKDGKVTRFEEKRVAYFTRVAE